MQALSEIVSCDLNNIRSKKGEIYSQYAKYFSVTLFENK